MRIRNEPVAVRLADSRPAQFIWRSQLWRVLAVQRNWVEAGAWWHDPRVLSGGGELLGDRQIWRIEASAGAQGQVGVYELSCQGADDWRLRSVID